MADKEAQPSSSMTRIRTHGTRWANYLLKDKIVRAVCYRAERSSLLEETLATTTDLAEWTWQTNVLQSHSQATLGGLVTRLFPIFIFVR